MHNYTGDGCLETHPRKTKTSSVLKVRVAVERKLYYCYRFISEFSGKSIDHDDVKAFRHQFYKKGSVSSRSLEGISKRIKETKVQIDNILKLLNDAAEYRSSESNIKLQWIMMIVTILSLFVALYSIKNGDVINEIKNLIEWIKTHSWLRYLTCRSHKLSENVGVVRTIICRSPRIPDSHSAHWKKRKQSEKHSNILG